MFFLKIDLWVWSEGKKWWCRELIPIPESHLLVTFTEITARTVLHSIRSRFGAKHKICWSRIEAITQDMAQDLSPSRTADDDQFRFLETTDFPTTKGTVPT